MSAIYIGESRLSGGPGCRVARIESRRGRPHAAVRRRAGVVIIALLVCVATLTTMNAAIHRRAHDLCVRPFSDVRLARGWRESGTRRPMRCCCRASSRSSW